MLFVAIGGLKERSFFEGLAQQLEAHGKTRVTLATGQRDTRNTREIRRDGEDIV